MRADKALHTNAPDRRAGELWPLHHAGKSLDRAPDGKEYYRALNPIKPSGILRKNFPFHLWAEAFHRFEPRDGVELARCVTVDAASKAITINPTRLWQPTSSAGCHALLSVNRQALVWDPIHLVFNEATAS